MKYSIEEIHNDTYEASDLSVSARFSQSLWYKEAQEMQGKKSIAFFAYTTHHEKVMHIRFFLYTLFSLGNIRLYAAYAPYAPTWKDGIGNEEKKEMLEALFSHIQKNKYKNIVFFRIEENVAIEKQRKENRHVHVASGKARKGSFMQPEHEYRVSLKEEEKEIRARMHIGLRRDIQLGERDGASCVIYDDLFADHFDTFYALMEETAKRNSFSLHTKSYYKNLFVVLEKNKRALLSFVYEGETLLATALIYLYGDEAYYAFGASKRGEHIHTAPAYMHHALLQEVKKRGFLYYNLGGVSEIEDKKHAWAGLSFFKRKFGGKEISREFCYDILKKPLLYYLFVLYKQIR